MKKTAIFLGHYKILIILLFIAFFLRVVDINNNPKALYGDELTIVYDSYSILTTAHDSTGAFLPLTFRMGAGRPGGYVYGSVPFVALFGPSALGVRSLSILSGLGIIILMFLLGKKLFNKKVGLIAAAIMTFSPWDISLSRGGFEAHLALFLALLGTVILIYGRSVKHFFLAAIFFGLTLHTYPTYKLVLPLFLILLFWFLKITWREIFSRKIMPAVIVMVVFVILAIFQTFTGGSEDRFLNLNLFSDHDTSQRILQNINYERKNDNSPTLVINLIHNRYVVYSSTIINSYLENFGLDFLFISGDQNPVHNPATTGELFYGQMILLIFGLLYLTRENRYRDLIFFLLWIFLAPISAAFLLQTHALRSAFMLPPLILISSLGGLMLWQLRKITAIKITLILIFVLLIGQFLFFAEELYFVSEQKFSDFWAYPAKKISDRAIMEKPNYQYIFINSNVDSIKYAYLVYAKINPHQVVKTTVVRINDLNFEKYDNVYLGQIPPQNLNKFFANFTDSYLYLDANGSKQSSQFNQ